MTVLINKLKFFKFYRDKRETQKLKKKKTSPR